MRFETQTNLYGDIPLAERFKALDTQFAITQGHIDALISESELRELLNGDKTMYSAMNDIKIDVNGLRANLTSLTTEVDGEHGITAINNKLAEYEGTIDGFSANFERITEVVNHTGYNSYTEAVQAKIDAGIDGFNSTIQSTYYTKNDVYTKSEVNSELQGVSGAFTSAISNVQSQIDNKIETWCRDGVPTASNYPASNWTTTVLKDQHIGDLYYDTKNGYAYQYTKQNNNYSWNVVTTSGIGNALTLAGNKRRVFVTEPTPPYEIGDLWVQGESGDIMRCGTPRASGNYTESDWVKASKYTDDSTFNTFKTGQYAQDITAIGAQLDNKVEIHYGTVVPTLNNAPANSWSTSERAEHLDDLYYNTSTGYCYRFIISGTTYSWVRIKDSDITSAASVASTAQSIANGKATIFTGSTTPALPRIGDLWLKSANDDILTYVNDTDKWQKYNKYTDDTTANQVASNLANNYSTTTQIQQNANGIITTAISNVDGANFISRINQTAESISIDADKINLSGFISANGTFTIDENGYLRADGGTIGGWTLSDNKIYSGSSSYVILNPMQTGLSVAVFAVGAKRLTNVPSEMKADNVPFYITSSGDVYASSMHLTGTVVSEIPGSVSAFNYKLYLGVSGFFTASDTNINRKGVQINSKSIGFYSFDHRGEELGYIGSSYDSSTEKTKFLIGAKAANTNSLVIGTAAKQESAVITHEPYITINDSSSGMIRFNKYIQTNLYVQDSMATNAQRGFLSYRRMSLYKDISQTTGQSIWIDSAVENDTSIIRNRVVGGSVAQGPAVRIWANGTNNNRNFVEISSGGIDVYVYSTMSSGKPMYNGTRVVSFAV